MRYARLCLLLCWVSMSYSPLTVAEEVAEYTAKAAFLYNFAIFTTWPDSNFDVFNLCIYGADPFGKDLDKLMKKKRVNERSVTIYRISNLDQLEQCQLIFISHSEIDSLTSVIDTLRNKPILTVADSPDAARRGATINLAVKDNKVTFEVNLSMVRKAGLNLNAQLLRFATKVHQ